MFLALFYDKQTMWHHCDMLCLSVASPVGRDGRPPTHIPIMGWFEIREKMGERKKGRKREREVHYICITSASACNKTL